MDETRVSFRRAPLGDLGVGGLSIGSVENMLKEGSGYGASLCMGALLRDPGVGAPSLDGYGRNAVGTGSCPYGGSVGQRGVGSSTRNFERWLKGTLGVGHLVVGAL
jgi:hypothetical protein